MNWLLGGKKEKDPTKDLFRSPVDRSGKVVPSPAPDKGKKKKKKKKS